MYFSMFGVVLNRFSLVYHMELYEGERKKKEREREASNFIK